MILPADPKASYLAHREEIDAAIRAALESGSYILGKEVVAFEEEFADYIGTAHAIGVGSGTDAIVLALRACGIGPGDAVATVSHTAVATVAAVDLAGAEPVLVDIDPGSFTLDPNRLEATLNEHIGRPIRAVIPVHLYGHPADMDAILDLARRFDLYVIEDCAQSHGATYRGKRTGSFGHFGAFSFYPTKNLGALGDAGACVCNDAELAAKARLLRQYGWKTRYTSELRGMNSRLDELQAAVLRVKLRWLEADNARRRQIAATYHTALLDTGWIIPCERSIVRHVYHQYTVLAPRRDEVRQGLQDRNVAAAVLYPSPVHCQPAYAGKTVIGAGGLEQSEAVCRDLLCLPIHPQLSDEQLQSIITAIHQTVG